MQTRGARCQPGAPKRLTIAERGERRLHRAVQTSSMNDYSYGVANRGCSVRIGRMVPVDKCGYYEDRRPASNLDPYIVCRLLVETTVLSK
jgi:glutamine synthetase